MIITVMCMRYQQSENVKKDNAMLWRPWGCESDETGSSTADIYSSKEIDNVAGYFVNRFKIKSNNDKSDNSIIRNSNSNRNSYSNNSSTHKHRHSYDDLYSDSSNSNSSSNNSSNSDNIIDSKDKHRHSYNYVCSNSNNSNSSSNNSSNNTDKHRHSYNYLYSNKSISIINPSNINSTHSKSHNYNDLDDFNNDHYQNSNKPKENLPIKSRTSFSNDIISEFQVSEQFYDDDRNSSLDNHTKQFLEYRQNRYRNIAHGVGVNNNNKRRSNSLDTINRRYNADNFNNTNNNTGLAKQSRNILSMKGNVVGSTGVKKEKKDNAITRISRPCRHCGETSSCTWRPGPAGKGTLCNTCGFYYRKHGVLNMTRKDLFKNENPHNFSHY
eukprot:Pgem_evm1s967